MQKSASAFSYQSNVSSGTSSKPVLSLSTHRSHLFIVQDSGHQMCELRTGNYELNPLHLSANRHLLAEESLLAFKREEVHALREIA